MSALSYLQTEVAATVNHENENDEQEFRFLAAGLFGDTDVIGFDSDDDASDNIAYSSSFIQSQECSRSGEEDMHIRRTAVSPN